MEHKIEFVGVDTPALYRKVYWHMSKRGRSVNLVIFAAAILWAAVMYSKTARTSYLTLAVIYALLALWYQLRPLRAAKRAYENCVKYNDGVIPPTTVRFGDHITFLDHSHSTEVGYHKIKKIHILKEGLVMDMQENRVHFSAIDRFTEGSMQELKQFLREKRPDLRITD